MLCTKMLSLVMKDLASLDFPAYGSLYLDRPLESHMKIPLEQGFCIGPHCSPVYWNWDPGELELYSGPSPNCGPCQFSIFFLIAVLTQRARNQGKTSQAIA